jgi:hypothetical protein
MKYLALAVSCLSLTACVGIGGESVDLGHEPLKVPEAHGSGSVSLVRPAADSRPDMSRIGRATITVFAFTSGNVHTLTPLGEQVADQVEGTLRDAGFDVRRIDGTSSPEPGSSVMSVTIRQLYFRNYNWFWPIVPTWGDIELVVQVRSTQGQLLVEKDLKGSGSSLCLKGSCAFRNATREAMTEVLNQLVAETSTAEFKTALAPPPAPVATPAALESPAPMPAP